MRDTLRIIHKDSGRFGGSNRNIRRRWGWSQRVWTFMFKKNRGKDGGAYRLGRGTRETSAILEILYHIVTKWWIYECLHMLFLKAQAIYLSSAPYFLLYCMSIIQPHTHKKNFTLAAAAAKSLQSCPTLCDPRDGSPPGSPIPGILQARTLEGCHFLLQCMKVKSESEVAQSCPTLSDPMDCSLPGSSIHGILQARVLEWGAIAFSITLHSLHHLHLGTFGTLGKSHH